ncbi:hypothetical protein ACFXPQ_18650 [Streptomyces lydicus]
MDARYAFDACSTATAMWCTAKSWSMGSSRYASTAVRAPSGPI